MIACRICDHTDLQSAVDLGRQPWANNFLTPDQVGQEPFYPLHVVYCPRCACAQLDYTVPKETMFANHTYVSGVTETLRRHFRETAEQIDSAFFAGARAKAVLDIGSNDGTQLDQYRAIGYDVLGVESCGPVARLAQERGIETCVDFFNLATASRIGRQFEVINASGVFFHLEELHSVTDGVRACLKPDGVFVVQFLYMKSIVENLAFDQIYHEHLLYYTLRTIEQLLLRHGLTTFDAYWSPIHGGSIILMAGHPGRREQTARLRDLLAAEDASGVNTLASYRAFEESVRQMKGRTLDDLRGRKAAGKRMYGLGAPVKGNTLLNTFGIGRELLECLVEKNAMRRGLISPGMHIPVLIEDELQGPPDVYFVLAWNFKREILQRHADLLARGVEFYFPVNPREAP